MSNFKFKKQFGQNFLKDQTVINKTIASSSITKHDLVIEVGPGAGALTEKLVEVAGKVIAYEIDLRLEKELAVRFFNTDNLDIRFKDFLEVDLIDELKDEKYENIYFVANLPYYITTPILNKLITTGINFKEIIVMVQKEVGERFTANPGSRNYGSMTVFLDYYFKREILFIVDKSAFIPAPKVDSCIVKFTPKEKKLIAKDEEEFFKLIRQSFKYKRKTIKNNLKDYDLELIEKKLIEHNFNLNSRAEQIPCEVFVDISNSL